VVHIHGVCTQALCTFKGVVLHHYHPEKGRLGEETYPGYAETADMCVPTTASKTEETAEV
jgi:hypothetical protein